MDLPTILSDDVRAFAFIFFGKLTKRRHLWRQKSPGFCITYTISRTTINQSFSYMVLPFSSPINLGTHRVGRKPVHPKIKAERKGIDYLLLALSTNLEILGNTSKAIKAACRCRHKFYKPTTTVMVSFYTCSKSTGCCYVVKKWLTHLHLFYILYTFATCWLHLLRCL